MSNWFEIKSKNYNCSQKDQTISDIYGEVLTRYLDYDTQKKVVKDNKDLAQILCKTYLN